MAGAPGTLPKHAAPSTELASGGKAGDTNDTQTGSLQDMRHYTAAGDSVTGNGRASAHVTGAAWDYFEAGPAVSLPDAAVAGSFSVSMRLRASAVN